MTEPTPATQAVTEPVTTPATVQATEPVAKQDPELWEDGKPYDAAKAKDLLLKLRNEVKELKPKAKLADELIVAENKRKEAEMTETEKAAAKLKETEDENKKLKRDLLVSKIAAEAELPLELAERLRGETEEELKADAATLKKLVPAKPTAPNLNATNPPNGTQAETDGERRKRLGL